MKKLAVILVLFLSAACAGGFSPVNPPFHDGHVFRADFDYFDWFNVSRQIERAYNNQYYTGACVYAKLRHISRSGAVMHMYKNKDVRGRRHWVITEILPFGKHSVGPNCVSPPEVGLLHFYRGIDNDSTRVHWGQTSLQELIVRDDLSFVFVVFKINTAYIDYGYDPMGRVQKRVILPDGPGAMKYSRWGECKFMNSR